DPTIPDSLNDRAADCWRPLLAIADLAGGSWPEIARQAALALSNRNGDDGSTGVQLLVDIHKIFQSEGVDGFFSETLIAELAKMEDRPWPEWKNGKAISKSQLARILTRFDITVKTIRIGNDTAKGYKVDQFNDAFSRYLDSQTVTSSQPTPVLNCDGFKNVTTQENVTVSKTSQPTPVLHCDGVTFSTPRDGDAEEI